ncbi:unnamed protein product [Leptosia nina]|uniref:Uncharacterized protein n=1 Tax=Leptosia nina TaxID=320188 RepID=A0AAV1JHA7_9NEOP
MAYLRILTLLSLTLFKGCKSGDIDNFFEVINNDTVNYNANGAEIAWQSAINPNDPTLVNRAANYQKSRISWQNRMCDKLAALYFRNLLTTTQKRQSYLLCRGPKYTYEEIR